LPHGSGQGLLAFVAVAEDQGLLPTGEVCEQRRHRCVGGVGDLGDGDLVEPALQEQSPRRGRQGLAGGGLLALTPPLRSRCHASRVPDDRLHSEIRVFVSSE
jgi:hypothetical protein